MSSDELGNHEIGKLVGSQEKRGRGGEEGVGEEEIGDSGEAMESVGVVFAVGVWVGGPVEEEEAMERVGLVLDDPDDEAWVQVG